EACAGRGDSTGTGCAAGSPTIEGDDTGSDEDEATGPRRSRKTDRVDGLWGGEQGSVSAAFPVFGTATITPARWTGASEELDGGWLVATEPGRFVVWLRA